MLVACCASPFFQEVNENVSRGKRFLRSDLRRRGEGGGEGGKEREGKNGKKEEIGDQVATR